MHCWLHEFNKYCRLSRRVGHDKMIGKVSVIFIGGILSIHTHIHLHKYTYTHESYPVYPKKYTHGFVVLCFVVVMQSFIMNSHKVFIHIHQGCFAGTGAIVRLPQCP